jgi:hypothetical protein
LHERRSIEETEREREREAETEKGTDRDDITTNKVHNKWVLMMR